MTRHELETTSQIPRDELLGLLNTMGSHEQQRVTAQIVAVPADAELDEPAVIHAPAIPGFQITFRPSAVRVAHPPGTPARSLPVIALSFAVTLALGLVTLIVA